GASLNDEIIVFLKSVNIPIIYGYGMTETTATVSCYPEFGFELGTVGTLMPGVQAKIGENNELLLKGKTITKGYYNKPEANKEAFIDGWLRTGDAASLQGDVLSLKDRIKDLYKTANGKYIAPQAIEAKMGGDKYIEMIAVIGDKRKFVSALIVPAYPMLEEYAKKRGIKYDSMEELVNNEDILKLIEARIEEHQKTFASYEKIKRFKVLANPFTMESGELTNTLKVRRAVILNRYADLIDSMYQE
ncbi:MAG: AMP-binding protein, partial [Tannerellaceae bacterium]